MRHKLPAKHSVGIDIDPDVIASWRVAAPVNCELMCTDAVEYLERFPFRGSELVYADPPYLPETRRRKKIYRYEYTADDHVRLIETLTSLPCKVMISGYPSLLYGERLQDWFYREFPGISHTGPRVEAIWANFRPNELHDYRYVGRDFRERQRINRKKNRWCNKLKSLPPDERHALMSALLKLGGGSSSA